MAAQAISALVQAGGPTSPTQFGISPAQATQIGLTISSGLTPAFWIYCGFLVALVVSCAWMLFTPHQPLGSGQGVPADPGPYLWQAAAHADQVPVEAGTGSAVTPDLETAPTAAGARDGDQPGTRP
jgi:hypothetical protein